MKRQIMMTNMEIAVKKKRQSLKEMAVGKTVKTVGKTVWKKKQRMRRIMMKIKR